MIQLDPASLSCGPTVSVIITAHNEGDELSKTVRSIRQNSTAVAQTIVVDDASSDDCCEFAGRLNYVQQIRHETRFGVAPSRLNASNVATGRVMAFLDGHHQIEPGSIEQCAQLAATQNGIVCPDICGYDDDVRLHGAYFTRNVRQRYFSAEWKFRTPRQAVSRISSLKAPAYFIASDVYPKVKWSSLLSGWGGSEACLSLKAFFARVPILHLCGPLIRHKFKKRFHYDVGWNEVWRNQAIIARVCFEDSTWYRYWLPEVFEPHLTTEAKMVLESDEIKLEQAEFAKFKVRSDREFWTRLIFQKVPSVLE